MSKILKSVMLIGAAFAIDVFADDGDGNGSEPTQSRSSPVRVSHSTTVLPPSTPREQIAPSIHSAGNAINRPQSNNPEDDDCVVIETPPSTPRGSQLLPAAHPDFTNNSGLAEYMRMVRLGIFSEK